MIPKNTRLAVPLALVINGLLAQLAQAQHASPNADYGSPSIYDWDWLLTRPVEPSPSLETHSPTPAREPAKGGQGGNILPTIPGNPISRSPLLDALNKLGPAEREAALAQLAGADNANLAQATLSGARQVGDSALSAMRQPGEGGSRLWLQSLNNTGRFEPAQGRKDFHQTTQGLVLGADWSLGNEWRLGLVGGKSRSDHKGSHFKGELDSWHAGAYALRQEGAAALRLGAIHSQHAGDTRRSVAFSGYRDRLSGNYTATSQQAFAEFGYTLGHAHLSAEPFAQLGYERYSRKGHLEKGGEAALRNSGQAQDNFSTTLGLHAAGAWQLGGGLSLAPQLSAGWRHLYGKLDNPTVQMNPATGMTFMTRGIAEDKDSLVIDAGLELNLSPRHSLGVGYSGEFGERNRSHGLMGQWTLAF
ncbi:autotransporter outer membrane beta-barrel domain-containing protein [Pseudomonas vanderleydeniana]|uniref:Autotransporter outer membrane beta-barrel domain-containing protein n=1 Tax=Pseudomonas vanderleydeniana TaxID=2745495 RepID=A0A9E6PLY1_9PSED|nr:autotransporter outer membrane beta-barrel domain-containing protein [Pseudomonas vanderleydeniana]QXI28501.1 autotransporter outer membrane beta-barrel domain-containing protein [Pseudomonas vanderleydeniana]